MIVCPCSVPYACTVTIPRRAGAAPAQPMISYTVRLSVPDFELVCRVADETGFSRQKVIGNAIQKAYGEKEQ